MALIQILASGTPGSTDQLRTLEQDATLASIANKNISTTRPEFGGYVIYPDGTLTKDYSKVFFVNDYAREEFTRYMTSKSVVAILNIYGQPVQYNPVGEDTVPQETTAPTTTTTAFPSTSTTTNTTIVKATITVVIIPAVKIDPITYTVVVNMLPAETEAQTKTLQYGFDTTILPIQVNLSTPILTKANEFLVDILDNFIDEERELKTLLNFGEDRQNVVLAYRYGNVDQVGGQTLQVKLLQPIPTDVALGTPAFVSLELAKSTIDKVRVRFAPPIDATPYLRPKNMDAKANVGLGKALNNVTLKLLSLNTGSLGGFDAQENVSFEDQIYRRWYSFDFNSSELNIDFTDYNNFVFYGSAALRLEAFKQKLYKIESLTSQSIQFEGSVFTGVTASYAAGAAYLLEQSAQLSKEKETIIRGFDRYEQFLYFTPSGSNLPYSASAWYADFGYEYNPIAYWPKDVSGSLYSPSTTIAQDWFVTQSAIAQRFDEFNENNLVNTIPTHIREHDDNAAYITFVAMIGHFFDIIKPYIDQFPNIYSRYIDPNEELSKDLVTDIAESVGFPLPSLNSIYSISDNVIGTLDFAPRRDFTVETHKKLLHNLPLFTKTKGTRTALTTLLKTFGITDELIHVRESGTSETSSLYVFNEFSNGLTFDGTPNTYLDLLVSASNRIPYPRSLQFNMSISEAKDMTILTGDNKWALHVTQHPTIPELGRFELTSGSNQTLILSSSYQVMFDDELINVAIRTYDTGSYATLTVTQVDAEDIIFQSIMSEPNGANVFVPLWNATTAIQLGGSGSLVIGNYEGTIDEVRLWGINLTDDNTLNASFDMGSNAGDTYTDASNYLYVQLSFNRIQTGSLPTYLLNESPYFGKDGSPSLEIIEIFGDINLSSFSRYSRTVRQLLPEVGDTGYVTKKIKIAPPPVFTPIDINADGVKQLSRTRSIVNPINKKTQIGRNKVSITTSPIQTINQNIIRNLGLENINQVLGVPLQLEPFFNTTLQTLKKHYNQYYYVDVNVNRYIRILSEVNSVLNQVIDYFIPSKANLLSGITIEPTILERTKVPPLKKLRVYGATARRTENAASSLTGSSADFAATFNLSKAITVPTFDDFGGIVATIETQHEDWYDANLISQSLKPSRKVSINLDQTTIESAEYKVIDEQAEDWYTAQLVSQSLKKPKKATIHIVEPSQESGMLEVYKTQHEDWQNAKLVSESKKPPRDSSIVLQPFKNNDATYNTYDIQHEDWYEAKLISQSLKVPRHVRIKMEKNVGGIYTTYDLQHLDWATFAEISSSYVSGTVEYVSQSFMPWPKQTIDMGLDNLNKFRYNPINRGSEGAEPYNRLYVRKLFDYEIEAVRAESIPSLYTDALYEIPPTADFRDVGAYTFFNSPSGIYYYDQIFVSPQYTQPLNSEWNFDQQQFVGGVPTWSYGQSFNYNDVVYQNVTDDSPDREELSSVLQSSRPGNRKYYVFKTRSAYNTGSGEIPTYTGSIPTYIPPSLDGDNWARLRFRPIEKRIPRRLVFDTFVIPDPSLNNFTVTTIDANKIIDVPNRYLDIISVGSATSGSSIQGELALQNIATLFAIQTNTPGIRLRLYRTDASRAADATRPSTQVPTSNAGVLLDTTIGGETNSVKLINPAVNLVADSSPPLGKIYYTIDNLGATNKLDITIMFYYFAIEIEPRVPSGYLRKHYKFFRDNSTATKRRSWAGCKNTVDTTIDGASPVQVFVGDGTQLVVSLTQTNDEIVTGGGGTLNVT